MKPNDTPRLSSGTLVPLVLASIPEAATPALKSAWDAIALLCHACLLSVDFRLVGLGEDHRIDASSNVDKPQPLPAEWNDSRNSDYAFRYKHPESSMTFLIKINRLGSKAMVSGLGVGDDRVRSFDVTVKDYVSESSFPYTRLTSSEGSSSAGDGGGDNNDAAARQSLIALFISEGRIADFAALFKINIIQRLVPGLQKPGYEETSTAASAGASSDSTNIPDAGRGDRETSSSTRRPPPTGELPPHAYPRPYPFDDPLAAGPRRPPVPSGDFPPPGFEDEHQILRPRPGPGGFRPDMPMSGERDLYPPGLGPHDPLRIGGPRGGLRGGGGGGGMYPTADDPMFGGGGGGGGFYDDRAPPGARYDPVGPDDGPPHLGGFGGGMGGGGRRGPPGGGRGPPNPFAGFGSGDFI